MKKNISKNLFISFSLTLFFMLNIVSYAATENGVKSDVFLDESFISEPKEYVNNNGIVSTEIDSNEQLLFSEVKKAELKILGFDVDEVKRVETIEDKGKNTLYKKIYIDKNKYLLVDENNEIFKICNIKNTNKNSEIKLAKKQDVDDVVSQVAKAFKLSKEYELVSSEDFDNDYLNIVWMHRLENGVLNAFDSIKATINKSDGNVVFLRVFKEEVKNDKPAITQEEAIIRAKDLITSLGGDITKVSLCYTRPNYFWNTKDNDKIYSTIELAYKIILEDNLKTIYVHAITGEIIGGDISKSECAGSYGQTNSGLKHSGDCVDLAADGMATLGYSPSLYKKLDTSALRTYVQNHIDRSNAYGFYFCGHGSSSTSDPYIAVGNKEDDFDTMLHSSEVTGNWHFVFLDACHTGRTIWSNAFNISSNSTKRAYLGWNGTVNTVPAYEFAQNFWTLLGTMSIRDAAVDAANEVPGSGTTPIRFYGDSSYDGSPH